MKKSTRFLRFLRASKWALVGLLLGASIACNTPLFNRRTVYVRPGQTMVLRETLENVKVWVMIDGEWEESDVATLPEGAYVTYKRDDSSPAPEVK